MGVCVKYNNKLKIGGYILTTEQYNELKSELNFYDYSVGIREITLKDTETISEILRDFNYEPIGYYETRNSEGFKFTDGNETFSISERHGNLEISKLVEL